METTDKPSGNAPERSSEAGRGSWRARALWVAALVCSFALLNAALSFVFENDSCRTALTWTRYRMLEPGSIDTVIIGSSHSLTNLDPYVFDEELGTSTFNLAFYGLCPRFSKASYEKAQRDFGIERCYLGISRGDMMPGEPMPAKVMYTRYKGIGETLPERLEDVARVLFYPYWLGESPSIELFFPWTINGVENDFQTVADNVRDKLTRTDEERAAGPDAAKGFTPNEERVFDADVYAPWARPIDGEGIATFSQAKTAQVEEIAKECAEKGTKLYVFSIPQPAYCMLIDGPGYCEQWRNIKEVVEEAGGVFIDLNMIHPEVFKIADDGWHDETHLTISGAESLSRYVAQLVSRIERGENVEDDFFSYDEWDAYAASIDRIELVNFTTELGENELSVDAHLYAGPQVEAEYALQELDAETGEYETIMPYQASPHFALPLDGETHELRLIAREQGTDTPFDHYCKGEVVAG